MMATRTWSSYASKGEPCTYNGYGHGDQQDEHDDLVHRQEHGDGRPAHRAHCNEYRDQPHTCKDQSGIRMSREGCDRREVRNAEAQGNTEPQDFQDRQLRPRPPEQRHERAGNDPERERRGDHLERRD